MALPAETKQPLIALSRGKVKRGVLMAMSVVVLLDIDVAYHLLHVPDLHWLEKPDPAALPAFAPLGSMIVNLQSEDGMHYLRIGLTLELTDEASQAKLVERMVEVRSSVLMLLSAKRPEDLAGIDGKRELAKELLVFVQNTAATTANPTPVKQVLFTDFIVQ